MLACNVLLHHDTSAWITRPAPPLEDVCWSGVRLRQWERMWRKVVINFLYVVVAFTYIFPVNAVQVYLCTCVVYLYFMCYLLGVSCVFY